ncbi:MAG: ATP-binding cassette domain-containing protein [Verrucomicrobia bacterium]|nr:ATP-binding cassette domain-containing protein [Verrucomicrobiota bacterium]
MTATKPKAIIRIQGVEKTYDMGEVKVRALRGVNLEVLEGDYIAIMGPSGSGKSTLLNLLGCLDRPTAGQYYLGGDDVSQMDDDELSEIRGRKIGFIFQSYNLIHQLSLIENVQMPLFYQGLDSAKNNERCKGFARLVGLGERLGHRPSQLSGGQQQRVAVARSLVNDPLMILADEPTGNLDSKTGQEILDLLDRLNHGGKTIVLVTHDPHTAARARRVVHMRDGVVDRIIENERRPAPDQLISEQALSTEVEGRSRFRISLRPLRTMQVGIKSLLLHKLRSALTMLGIIFGVCSVIAMLAIGEGASFEAQEAIKKLGSANIHINAEKPAEDTKVVTTTSGRGSVIEYGLTYKDAGRIQATIPGISHVVPMRIIRENVRFFRNEVPGQVIGTHPIYADISGLDLIRGRFLAETDDTHQNNVCAISSGLAKRLFPYQDPLDQELKIGAHYYQVIGLVRETSTEEKRPQSGDSVGYPLDNNVYMPLSTAKSRFGETLIRRSAGSQEQERVQLHKIIVQFADTKSVETAVPQIQTLLNRFHTKKDFGLIVPLQLLRQAEEIKRTYNIVLGSIAAISLLVGGIGIMNIMLATVTERTREIGIRRALGAKQKDITSQFLVEAIVLAIGGGLIGVILGILTPFVVSQLTDMKTIVTPLSVLLAFGISGAVGIIFGLYPASRAAALDPIEALRHE